MRARLVLLVGVVGLLLVACPQPTPDVGDIELGEYDVRATTDTDSCEIGDVVQDGDFEFRVKLSGDSGTDRVYMVVSVPPSYAPGASVSGVVESGALVFSGRNATSLPACGCSPMVDERFVFEPDLIAVDGGGAADGGTSTDGGTDGGTDDGGDDAGVDADAGTGEDGVLGLPPLSEIEGMGGSLHYAVDTASGCQARDTDAGTGCELPCEIGYLLAGNLR